MDEDEIAFKAKQQAGTVFSGLATSLRGSTNILAVDAKAKKDMAEKAKGKGPLNAGQQGIKKSGKK